MKQRLTIIFCCDMEAVLQESLVVTDHQLNTHKRKLSDYKAKTHGTMKSHNKRKHKPYNACSLCEYVCSLPSNLSRHMNSIHSDICPFTCHECNFATKTKSHLNLHMKKHSGEKKNICKHCDKKFSQSSNLKTHQLIHSDSKPFKCSLCQFACSYPSGLRSHMNNIHSDKRPFTCHECNFATKTKSHLNKHIQTIHNDGKMFICEHCKFLTKYRGSLNTHLKMHEEQKGYPIECKLSEFSTDEYICGENVQCTIRCKTQIHMDYHIMRNHTAEGFAAKMASESKLAAFFTKNNITFSRDRQNFISFRNCKEVIEGGHFNARPDFYLFEKSAELGIVLLVGNDELAHRQQQCDLQRIMNIATALQETTEFKDVPLVYIRFNPHHFYVNGVCFDPNLADSHDKLLDVITCLKKEDIRPGVNLIYINYDQTNGQLDIFKDNPNNDYVAIYKPCVIKVI